MKNNCPVIQDYGASVESADIFWVESHKNQATAVACELFLLAGFSECSTTSYSNVTHDAFTLGAAQTMLDSRILVIS